MHNKYVTKDKGGRKEFPTGAQRETRDGKGRFDLLSPWATTREALVLERGGKKYSDRGWERGLPYSRYIDSALRHIMQYMMRMDDEDHLGHAVWNLKAIMHHECAGPEGLDDRPQYPKGE
jgi:hypothetical protein